MGIEEKIKDIEEEIQRTPYNKATSHHIGKLKAKLSKLKEAGIIDARQGSGGSRLARPLNEISLYDIYKAVDTVDETGLFHFHENPHPKCVVGGNIHKALDDKIQRVQDTMEDELRKITMADVVDDLTKEMNRRGQSV